MDGTLNVLRPVIANQKIFTVVRLEAKTRLSFQLDKFERILHLI